MMADVTGIPEGEDGAQKAQEEATGMGPGAMEDITGMKEGESEPEIDLDKITGMGPGAWGDITGMPSRPTKTGSRIVSRRRQPTWRRNTQPGIGRTQY